MFIWTIRDAVGLAVLGLLAIWAACIFVPVWWREMRRKRTQQEGKERGE